MDSYGFSPRAPTSANVKFVVPNNATFGDAIQFDPGPTAPTGVTGGTGPYWNFHNKQFRMDIKGFADQSVALLSLTSQANQIIVDSETQRILHFNVDDATIQAALVPGKYYYDFIMIDTALTPAWRVPLMHGLFIVTDGVTGG